MTVNLIFPTHEKPYIIDSKIPIILRIACYAGVNRSATIREILKQEIHKVLYFHNTELIMVIIIMMILFALAQNNVTDFTKYLMLIKVPVYKN